MKKAVMVLAALACGGWLAAGCQGNEASQSSGNFVSGVMNDMKTQAEEEIKTTVSKEIEEFFKSGDLAAALGISSDEQTKLEESVKNYISSYSADEENLDEAKKAVEKLLENAQGLSVEQLQSKIADIFN